MRQKRDVTERFNEKWTPEPYSGCHLWMWGLSRKGYGHFRDEHRVSWIAHRMAWRLFVGPIPQGMSVLHHCDTRMCVNPAHLYLGTQVENMRDCKARGRNARGERHSRAKLTEADVLTMRKLRAAGERYTELGEMFGVDDDTARNAILGKTWSHLHVGS